ncbi:MAG: hypothetical protein WBP18_18630 [Paracoccaceae bacterium]
MPLTPGPFDACLLPLAKLAARHPGLEGQVIWQDADHWQAQEEDEALLDAEEIAFYAEGLLAEGFGLHWQALADAEGPALPVLVRLYFWQAGDPPPPPLGEGWQLVASGRQQAS